MRNTSVCIDAAAAFLGIETALGMLYQVLKIHRCMSETSSMYLYTHIFPKQIEVCMHVSMDTRCVHS